MMKHTQHHSLGYEIQVQADFLRSLAEAPEPSRGNFQQKVIADVEREKRKSILFLFRAEESKKRSADYPRAPQKVLPKPNFVTQIHHWRKKAGFTPAPLLSINKMLSEIFMRLGGACRENEQRRSPKSSAGFTLIETLIYIALYSIIMGGAIVAVYAIFESAGRNQSKAMLQEEGMFLVGKLNWALSGVKTIDIPTISATSSQLSITKYDDTAITVVSTTGTMMIQNGGVLSPLNNTNTEVGGLVFTHVGAGGANLSPEGVSASFTLSSRAPNGMIITQDFSTTRYLRK